EIVVGRSHVQFGALLAFAACKRQVDGRAPAVAGDRGDVHAHQFSLVDAGIIFGFLALIRRVVRPFYEVPHSAGGAVAIEDLEPDLLFAQFRSDTLQSLRDRLQQVTARGVVSVDTLDRKSVV